LPVDGCATRRVGQESGEAIVQRRIVVCQRPRASARPENLDAAPRDFASPAPSLPLGVLERVSRWASPADRSAGRLAVTRC
jgi:hypothetical protein